MCKRTHTGVQTACERVRKRGYDYSEIRQQVRLNVGLAYAHPVDRVDALRDEIRLTYSEAAHIQRDREVVVDAIERAAFWKAWLEHKEARHAASA